MIKIIDCGSQLTQNIARRIRELGAFTEIVPFHTKPNKVLTKDLEGIIISGGQFSVYDENSPLYSKDILNSDMPILGICYGQQSIAHILGGKVRQAVNREYGETKVSIIKTSPLFKGIPKNFKVWMSHGDVVEEVPKDFKIIAESQNKEIAAMQKANIYSVQFHPEVDHTEYGRKILDNFLTICNAARIWDPTKEYNKIIKETKEKIKGKTGVGGISGGVDSTTLSVLLNKIADKNYHPIFIDNGLLRLNELAEVKSILNELNLNVIYVDARKKFLKELKGITNPDEKRKIIGNEFIKIFEEEAKKLDAEYLAQGTLYPDVIESVPVYGSSSKIKRHHNVGGLPEKMNLKIIEPFKNLFKDEVRKIAKQKLGLPKKLIYRHPFPGPGLGVRIIGEITKEKLMTLKKADSIFIEELKKRNIYNNISQAFAILTSTQSVGVMGDEHTYKNIIALRAVTTKDFMTADWYDFDKKDLTAIVNRIINEVDGINRVVYDITQKPPGTIEWE